MHARYPISMACLATTAFFLARCLPGDTRPPPAMIHLTVEPSPAVIEGFTTADGWHISFERLLVGIGDARLGSLGNGNEYIDPSVCTLYANARYERLFDLTVGGPQTLSDVYGLGTCGVGLSVTIPWGSAPLGEGVSAEDLAFMRDSVHHTAATNHARSVYVRGQATRDTTTKRFEWSFGRQYTLQGCVEPGGVGFASDVVLTSGAVVPLRLIIHGEELFRENRSDERPLRFDALAAADTDGDQVITQDELGVVADSEIDVDGGMTSEDGGTPSLADLLYFGLTLRMTRVGDSGPCLGAYQ
jgi:hypothetical protein